MKIKIKVTKQDIFKKLCSKIVLKFYCVREHVNGIQKLQISSLFRDVLKRQNIL